MASDESRTYRMISFRILCWYLTTNRSNADLSPCCTRLISARSDAPLPGGCLATGSVKRFSVDPMRHQKVRPCVRFLGEFSDSVRQYRSRPILTQIPPRFPAARRRWAGRASSDREALARAAGSTGRRAAVCQARDPAPRRSSRIQSPQYGACAGRAPDRRAEAPAASDATVARRRVAARVADGTRPRARAPRARAQALRASTARRARASAASTTHVQRDPPDAENERRLRTQVDGSSGFARRVSRCRDRRGHCAPIR